eukprot:scaffold53145_cov56-Phaeocystis_antarctica.AAC.4
MSHTGGEEGGDRGEGGESGEGGEGGPCGGEGGGDGGEGGEGGEGGIGGGGDGSPGQLQPEQSKPFLKESWAQVHAPHTSDRARPAGTASETNASLCKYAGRRFIVASGLAESRGGLVAASLAVVSAAGESRRCGADSTEVFARGVELSASEEWEARRISQRMLLGRVRPEIVVPCYHVRGPSWGLARNNNEAQQPYHAPCCSIHPDGDDGCWMMHLDRVTKSMAHMLAGLHRKRAAKNLPDLTAQCPLPKE